MKLKRPLEPNTVFCSDGIHIEKLRSIVATLCEYAKENDIAIEDDDSYITLSGMLEDECGIPEVIGWIFGYGFGVREKDCDNTNAEYAECTVFARPNFPFDLDPEAYGADKWAKVEDWFTE